MARTIRRQSRYDRDRYRPSSRARMGERRTTRQAERQVLREFIR